jgi:hypothetical protein
MNATEHLSIDPFDPQDVQAKLPEMRRMLAAKRKELEALNDQIRSLGELVELFGRLAPPPPSTPSAGRDDSVTRAKSAPGQDRAVAALERAGQPMGPAALYAFMQAEGLENMPKNANALGANLWSAVKAGRIKKLEDGRYASLVWEPPSPEPVLPLSTDYRRAAEYGMPVPGQRQDREGGQPLV